MNEKETRRASAVSVSIVVAVIVFVAGIFLTLMWLAFLFGFWGSNELEVVLTIPNGLFLLILICGAVGAILWHSYTLERKNTMLEQKVESLAQTEATFERSVYYLTIKDGKIFRGKHEIGLANKEFRLLYFLEDNAGLSETQKIIEYVWVDYYDNPNPPPDQKPPNEDDLKSLIRRLREKINVQHDYIKSHRGRGYEFVQWKRLQ